MKLLIKLEEPTRFFENLDMSVPKQINDFYPIEVTSIQIRDKIYSQLKKKHTILPFDSDKSKRHTEVYYFIDMSTALDFLMDIRLKYKNNLNVFTWIENSALKIIFPGEGEEQASILEWLSKRYLKLKSDDGGEC